MNYCLLYVALLIVSSYLSELSYSNHFSYDIYVSSLYSTGRSVSISVTCVSNNGQGGDQLIKKNHMFKEKKFLQWTIKEGEYGYDTVQKCTLRDSDETLVLVVFKGSWKLDEIIWKTYTRDDFILRPQNGERTYYWAVGEEGVYLHNSKTRKYELVVPTNNNNLHDQVYVSNFFNDERKISVICMSNEESADGGVRLANVVALDYRFSVGWFLTGNEYVEGKVHTCLVGWKSKTPGRAESFYFSAFKSSWRDDEILHRPYTRDDFIFNPYTKKRNYLWGVGEKGLTLYNFLAKEYQAV